MVLKKVLLGFVTTTSLILLVMVAPTTTTTATASLQQQEGNATIDEPNIPIGPADEEEEPDDEPILRPDNENNDTDDDIGEPPIAEEPIGPANETNNSGNNNNGTNIVCQANIWRQFGTDKERYKQGEDVIVTGAANTMRPRPSDVSTPVEVVYSSPSGEHHGSHEVQPEYEICSFSFSFTIENVIELGTWEVSAFFTPGDDGEVIGKAQFEVVATEEPSYCHKPPRRELDTGTTTHKLGDDVIVSGLFSPSPRDRENNTPVEVRYKGPEDARYVSNKVQPKYTSYGECRYLGFEFVIKNVQQLGLWDVSAVYPPLKIDLYTQFVVYPGVGNPRCEDIGSPGNGNADDDYCRDDGNKPDGPIDTWIFQITAPEERGSQSIHYGGTIRSSTVDLNIESWASSGGGVSHVELKIDNGKYKRLAPPDGENNNGYSYSGRTIKGLSDGTHTIYARTVDKAGNVDPTPAQWKFTVR
jgi:hypothetical protein